MASKVKKYGKSKGFFNNDPECVDGYAWSVETKPHYNEDKYPDRRVVEAQINISRGATSHYVDRKADLRPLHKMRRELDAFIKACEEALKEVD